MNQLLAILAFFIVALMIGSTRDSARAQESKKSLSTPQETFHAAQIALKKEDLVALCDCMTDDSRDLLGGGLAVNVMIAKKILGTGGSEDDQRLMKKIDEVLAKHGLFEKNLRQLDPVALAFLTADLPGRLKAAGIVLTPVKDRNSFVADLVAALQKKGTSVGGLGKGSSELTDLVISGDTAKAVVVNKVDSKETRNPIVFHKVGGAWKIDMTAELNKTFSPKGK